uniref:BRCT domain-containing protein n=1 Tax=Taenia asiatica TaxID=60517 RepID=A0A0R3WB70_TAEAS
LCLVVPVTEFQQLHLSQEFSQAQVGLPSNITKSAQPKVVAKPKSPETVGISSLKSGFSLLAKRYSRCDQSTTSKRVAIALGASARILKHHMRSKERALVPNVDELTQPMGFQPNEEASPNELFAMTQTPPLIEPSAVRLDEFPDLSNKPNHTQSADADGVSMRRSRRDEDASTCSQRGSKLSLASTFKRSSFLRSLSRGSKRRNQSQSPESRASSVSSGIPPLRERLSTSSAAVFRRKKRRRTNELYSPWLQNSRLHFLKKYRVPPASSKARTSVSSSANVFSPGWSRLKSLSTDFGRQSKTQLLIRSTKKRSSSKGAFKPVEATSQPPNSGPVCRFILPSRGSLFEGSAKKKTAALLCSHCGYEIILISKPATVLTSPKPYPVVRDLGAYWPESWRHSPLMTTRQGVISTAATPGVTILPSYVSQTPPNSFQSCDPSIGDKTNHIQIPITPEKGTPSTINIQPSLVPQSFSLNTQSSKGSCGGQAEAAKPDRLPSPQTMASSDTLCLSATVVKAVDVQPTPTLLTANPIIPETPLQTMATRTSLMPQMHKDSLRRDGVKDNAVSLTVKKRVVVEILLVLLGLATVLAYCVLVVVCSHFSFFLPPSLNARSSGVTAFSVFTHLRLKDRGEQEQNRSDLEAEVSRLEQQLVEGALNSEHMEALLATPGTEPMEETETGVISSSSRESTSATTPAVCLSPDSFGLSPSHAMDETSRFPLSTDKATGEMTKLDMIPDTNALEEGLDVIPSSQNEEEDIHFRSDEPRDETKTPITEAISVPLNRIESSQPVTAGTFEAIPLSPTPCTYVADTIPFTQPRLLSTSLIVDTENINPKSQEDESTRPTIFITGSNLSQIEVSALRRFCRHFNAVETPSFEPNRTTHVVMATQVMRPRVAQRTLKYFMGILHGAWVVNTHWVRRCLLAATLLPEVSYVEVKLGPEAFEVRGDTMCGDCHEGPRRGRLRVPAIPHSLDTSGRSTASVSCSGQSRPFTGLMLCPFGEISPLTPKDFEGLVIAGGGIPIAGPSLFPSEAVATTTDATENKPKRLILTCPMTSKFQRKDYIDVYNKYKVPVINLNWMLNCASVYRRLPISKVYYVYPTE